MLTAFCLLQDTISGFKGVLDGKYDDLPEMVWLPASLPFLHFCAGADAVHCPQAFYMVGDIKEVSEKVREWLHVSYAAGCVLSACEFVVHEQADKMARDMASSN